MYKYNIDLTGQKFGKLTVIKESFDKKNRKGKQWKCQCSCKNKTIVTVSAYNLITGKTKSCGCLHNKGKLLNYYIEKDGYIEGYDFKNFVYLVDKEDYDKIKEYKWTVNPSTGYVWCNELKQFLQDFIIPHDKNTTIDHINRIKTDNRKSNLRLGTMANNNCNREKLSNNTSGIIGVSWCNRDKAWSAQIYRNNKKIHCGNYKNKKDAIIARLKAEKEYYSEFAPQKYLFEEYNI